MADNASAVLVDDRLGYGALGLHQAGPEDSSQQPVQLGYIFPGTEYERTYTQGNHVLRRYHSATIGGISRSSLAVTVAAIAVAEQELLAVENDSAPEADVWGLIKAAWVRSTAESLAGQLSCSRCSDSHACSSDPKHGTR
eukprot:SAG25_NODE_1774_length_2356_cov_5.201595_1_plen_139_part_10